MADSEKWIDLTQTQMGDKPGGLMKKVLVEGKSPYCPKPGMEVKVHYHGTLESNGNMFDSSIERGEHYKFTLGQGRVIRGWEVGVGKMRWGEKSILRCRKDYAYGDEAAGPRIPAGSTLDFEVELFHDYKDVEKMQGVQSFRLDGEASYVNAKEEAKVSFEFAICDEWGKLCGVEKQTFDMEVMEENTFGLWPEWFHECLMTMGDGQQKIFSIRYDSNYQPCNWWNLPPNPRSKKFYFRILMTKMNNPPDLWQMDYDAKMDESKRRKELGNEFFKKQDFKRAARHYRKGAECLQAEVEQAEGRGKDKKKLESLEQEFSAEFRDLYCGLYSNLSMAHIKQKVFDDGRDAATKVLEYEPQHLKALARRAQCRIQTGDPFGAKDDLDLVLSLDPENKYSQQLMKVAEKRIKAYEKKKKKMAAKMFG